MNNTLWQKAFMGLITIMMAVLAWQANRMVSQLDNVSSSLTGHLIQHGRTDADNENMAKRLEKIDSNVNIICGYEEDTWPNHERCKH